MRFEDLNSIQLRKKTLEWDIEYWQSYIRSYENDDIQCSDEEKISEIKRCNTKLQECKDALQEYVTEFAEEFI